MSDVVFNDPAENPLSAYSLRIGQACTIFETIAWLNTTH